MDELVVFLMRQFGWSLEYTTDLVRNLEIGKLNTLVAEVKYQKAVEDYDRASNFAMAIANWASAQGKRKYRIKDFIGPRPRREPQTKAEVETEQRVKENLFIAELQRG